MTYNFRIHRLLATPRHQRFLILAHARTGSNLLMSYLNSLPNVRCHGEVFRCVAGREIDEIFRKVYGRDRRKTRAKGFKIFYDHPVDNDGKDVWDVLSRDKKIKVIHLKRQNVLRTLLSRKLAVTTNTWVDRRGVMPAPGSAKTRVSFTKEELLEGFNRVKAQEEQYASLFREHQMIDVYYEGLVSDPMATIKRVTSFIGVPFRTPVSSYHRQNPEPAASLILDWDELKHGFDGTPWSDFFRNEQD